MNDETRNEGNQPQEPEYEEYGWEFHKGPLLYAVVLTAIFYAFIFFYVNI